MPQPQGYRKALRLFKHADKFNIPIVTIIDTPGAYPGMSRSRLCENMNNPEVVKSPLVTTSKPINVCGDEDCYAGNNCK